MHAPRILLVGGERSLWSRLRAILRRPRYDLLAVADAASAESLLAAGEARVVIADLEPSAGGLEFLRRVAARWPRTVRLLLTGRHTLDLGVHALQSGEIARLLVRPLAATHVASAVCSGLALVKANQAATAR